MITAKDVIDAVESTDRILSSIATQKGSVQLWLNLQVIDVGLLKASYAVILDNGKKIIYDNMDSAVDSYNRLAATK